MAPIRNSLSSGTQPEDTQEARKVVFHGSSSETEFYTSGVHF